MQKKLFTELGLAPELLKAIARVGYEEASPIQSAAIPALLEGADVVGQSQTGSGKTAAFAVPAIQLVDPSVRAPQALILCPTRELAVQVAEEVAKLAFFKRGVRELPIYGGQSYERQFRGLQQGAQIVIGTPGRVMDHLERGTLRLDAIKMVILDEADRMLDMGFIDDIKTVLSQAPEERQTVMFSATLAPAIRELIKRFTKNPVNIKIESAALTVPAIEQVYYEVDRRSKVEALCRLIDLEDVKLGLIFCATKMMVDELTEQLTARGYSADKLHGDMSQAMRERVMAKFRKRGLEFLVATDVAARGVDVDDIEVVFNYDLPQDSEDYVHRIGRTGRAGKAGKAVTFVAGREIWKLQNIIRATKGTIRRERVPSLEQVEAKRSNAFFEQLRETLEKGEYERQDELIDRLLDQGHTATDIVSALLHLAEVSSGKKTPKEEEKPTRQAKRELRKMERQQGERDFSRETPQDFSEKRDFDQKPHKPARQRTVERDFPRDFDEKPRKTARKEATGREFSRDKFQDKFQDAAPAARLPRSARKEGALESPDFRSDFRPARKAPAKVSPEAGMVRLVVNMGLDHDATPGDIVGVVAGVAKVPRQVIGAIRMMARQSYVDIARDSAAKVVEKLSGTKFRGRPLHLSTAAGKK